MTAAIILAGGFGTRLRDTVPGIPKPLAPVNGRPFLDHQLDWVSAAGVGRIVVAAHFLADQIFRFAEERTTPALPIEVVVEDTPLGTGGAARHAMVRAGLSGAITVLNGDTLHTFLLADLIRAHDGSAAVTMATAAVADCARYGTVDVEDGLVRSFAPASGEARPGLVSCGAYIIDTATLSEAPDGAFSIEADFFPGLARAGRVAAFVVDGDEAFTDIGTPESYARANSQ